MAVTANSLRGAGVAPEKMMQSITDAMQMLSKKYKERFVIRVGEHLRSVETADIRFFFSREKTSFAQTADGRKHVLDYTRRVVRVSSAFAFTAVSP